MRYILIGLLFLSATSVHEWNTQGGIYFEAGEWEEAEKLYRKVVERGALSGEPRATARYNLAATLLALDEPAEALAQLDSALLGQGVSPPLYEQWHICRAAAALCLAEELAARAEEEQLLSLCDEGIERCRDGFEALTSLESPPDELREAIKLQSGRLRQLRRRIELALLGDEELIARLLRETRGGVSLLEQISEESAQPQRLARSAQQSRHLLGEWDELLRRGDLESEKAIQLFEASIGALESGHLWEGRACQAHAATFLDLLLATVREEDPLHPLLKRRLALLERSVSCPSRDLSGALVEECAQLSKVASSVASHLAQGVEDEVVSTLISSLAGRMEASDREAAAYDLLLYEQMGEPEEQTLLRLYQKEASPLELRAIEERFLARDGTEEIASHLRKARSSRNPAPHLGLALRAWSPPTWLIAKVGELRARAELGAGENLAKEHEPLLEIAPEEVASSLTSSMEASQLGWQQRLSNHPLCSLVCMEEVRHRLTIAEALLEMEEEWTPELLLQRAIDEQKHALELARQLEEASSAESILEPMVEFGEGAEQRVLDVAYSIHPDQFEEEMRPRFLQGAVEAEAAKRALAMRRPNWTKAMAHQRRAIELWEQMQRPDESEGEGQSEEESPDDSSSSSDDHPPEGEESTPQQIYEWLEQMEREDKQSKPTSQIKVKQGARPW